RQHDRGGGLRSWRVLWRARPVHASQRALYRRNPRAPADFLARPSAGGSSRADAGEHSFSARHSHADAAAAGGDRIPRFLTRCPVERKRAAGGGSLPSLGAGLTRALGVGRSTAAHGVAAELPLAPALYPRRAAPTLRLARRPPRTAQPRSIPRRPAGDRADDELPQRSSLAHPPRRLRTGNEPIARFGSGFFLRRWVALRPIPRFTPLSAALVNTPGPGASFLLQPQGRPPWSALRGEFTCTGLPGCWRPRRWHSRCVAPVQPSSRRRPRSRIPRRPGLGQRRTSIGR